MINATRLSSLTPRLHTALIGKLIAANDNEPPRRPPAARLRVPRPENRMPADRTFAVSPAARSFSYAA